MAYIPRLAKTADSTGYLRDMWLNPWWYDTRNTYYAGNYGLCNCTCYVFGRCCEIANQFLNLCSFNAENWWNDSRTFEAGFTRSSEPSLGAVVCWYNASDQRGGHVAIVEQIIDNDTITISESGWAGSAWTSGPGNNNYSAYSHRNYFRTETLRRSNGWMCPWMDGLYSLQGFLTNPYADSAPIMTAEWHAKTYIRYSLTDGVYCGWDNNNNFWCSREGLENAYLMWSIMAEAGWSFNAACAVIGVCSFESGLNPWSWENWNPVASTNLAWLQSGPHLSGDAWFHGYGLYGLTTFYCYPGDAAYPGNWCYGDKGNLWDTYDPHFDDIMGSADDGDAQTRFVIKAVQEWGHYAKRGNLFDYNTYPYIDWPEFIVSMSDDYVNLTRQWLWNFGAGNSKTADLIKRSIAADYFFHALQGWTPSGGPANELKKKKMPIWMMLKYF